MGEADQLFSKISLLQEIPKSGYLDAYEFLFEPGYLQNSPFLYNYNI